MPQTITGASASPGFDPRAPHESEVDRRHPGAEPGRPGWPVLEEVLLAIAVAVNLIVAFSARHFPYQDAPNHIARYVLMDRFWSGEAPANIAVRLIPGPYLAVDLIGVGLVRLLGPLATERVLAFLALTLLPCGMYLLLRATAPARRGWALAAVLLSFSWFLLGGLLNFSIGIGLTFFWLAWWWPRRAEESWRMRLVLALGIAGLFLVHMAAALTALVVVWVDWALGALPSLASWRRTREALFRPEVRTAVTATAAVGLMMAWGSAMSGGEQAAGGHLVFRSPASKIAAFGAPFYSFSLPQAALMAGGYMATVLAFGYAVRRHLRLDAFLASAAVFVVLFLIFPRDVGGAGGTDIRWLVPAYLLPLCLSSGSGPARRALLVIPFLACLAHAAVISSYTRAIDRRLDDFDTVLGQLPPQARLLPLMSDLRSYPRVSPYQQYALWHIVRKRGQVPGLWSLTGAREGDPVISHFQHFTTLKHTYQPPLRWGTTVFFPLDWQRIAVEYDYIVQVSDDPRVQEYVGAHAREKVRRGAVILYEVTSARAGLPPTAPRR